MIINNEILTALIHCNYKAYLKGLNSQSLKTDFENVIDELRNIKKQNYIDKNSIKQEFKGQLFKDKNHYEVNQIYIDTVFSKNKINIKVDGLYFDEKKMCVILISPLEKVTKLDKLTVALQSYFIESEFKLKIDFVKIVFGKQFKEAKLKLSNFQKEISKIISLLRNLENAVNPPVFYKNTHCQVCEFSKDCLDKLRERDDLSLLGNLKEKEIQLKNNRGIFSVKQLSYIFRAKKNPYIKRKFLPELKALAIREQKTYILESVDLEKHDIEVFIDFEGIPDRSINYLIGLIIRNGDIENKYSFWANTEEEETNIFIELIKVLKPFKNFVLYHYGTYEIQGLKRILKKMSPEDQNYINTLIDNSFNLLTIFTNCIYPPTYTNSLKDIAHFLNFEWSDKNASGLQSIFWRYSWELDNQASYKDKLIRYNIEDCTALKVIKDWICSIPELDNENFEDVKNFKKKSVYKWERANFLVPDFQIINSYAYFNYQREKVLIKTYPKIGLQKTTRTKSIISLRPNKIITSQRPKKCESCNCEKMYRHSIEDRTVVDLKITKTGISRIIILYKNARYKCDNCKKIVRPTDEFNIRSKYGLQLQNWIINQMIQYRISYNKISEQLKESFDIDFIHSNIMRTKVQFANKYKTTFNEIINIVKSSSVIHIDETVFHIRNESCYVWVFTNIDAVFYLFRPTREADFLKEFLCDFNGVLISDFYAGYDAMKCAKQRCIIHLIRDLNDDLVKNQFDVSFRVIVMNFSKLLTNITTTINKFGLKKRNLNKHKKEVDFFFKMLNKTDFETNICLKWKKRFNSTRNELFTFLNYDGVPWNNNNAEAAIKAVALYRREYDGLPTKKGIQDYLTLLSIQQTCKYQGVNFFEFLSSGKISIYDM
jgi:predicted RecB family nuclease